MGPGITYTPMLARCLHLNALALAFSLAHTVADYGVIFATTDFNTWGVAAYLGVAGTVYGWWGWSMAQAARQPRRGAEPARPIRDLGGPARRDVPLHPADLDPGGHHPLRLAALRPLGGVYDLAGAARRPDCHRRRRRNGRQRSRRNASSPGPVTPLPI